MKGKVSCVLIALALAALLSACGPEELSGLALTPTLTQMLTPTPTPTSADTRLPSDTPTRTATPPPSNTPTPRPPTATPTLGIGATQIYTDGMGGLYVPAGEFLMGSTDADIAQAQKDCLNQLVAAGSGCDFNNEKPQHKVYLDAFWIDRTEVTNAMFAEFTAEKGYKTDAERLGGGYVFYPSANLWEQTSGADWQHPRGRSTNLKGLDAHPVVQVSWNDAKAYCEWAGRQLPTEAQWEKAARGMDRRQYPWGNDPVAGNLLNFADKNLNVGWADKAIDDGYQFTSPVGYYPAGASPYGALDMAGNVCEWVADWYDKNYYANSPDRNPAGPTSGQSRVLRSASWRIGAPSVRAANRGSVTPASRGDLLGFRCIRSTSP